MLVIIEGPDKSGKSTLAKEVAKTFGMDYVHFGKPSADPAMDYVTFLKKLSRPTVCDRFYLGEMVYGPMLRGNAGFKLLDLLTIERLCRLRQAVLIYAVTPETLVKERFLCSDYEAVTLQQNFEAARRFLAVAPGRNLNHIFKYNGSTKEKLSEMLNRLEGLLPSLISTAQETKEICTGIGSVDSPTVLVGESVNPRTTRFGLPFDHGVSADFLMRCVRKARLDERRLYLCNADTIYNVEVEYLARKGGASFTSLGEVADKRLTGLGVPHKKLYHPQYVNRFHHHDHQFYVKELSNAAY